MNTTTPVAEARPADMSPTELSGGDSPMSVRSRGMLPEPTLPPVASPTAEIDVWALACALRRARTRDVMRVTVAETRALADAVVELTGGLIAARALDRTPEYLPGEMRPDGKLPAPGEAWRTPRAVVDQLIGVDLSPTSPEKRT